MIDRACILSLPPRARFPSYVQKHLCLPFQWGVNDCVIFSIGWGEIVTGKDLLETYLPWENEKQAMAKVASLGGLNAEFDKNLTSIEPKFANDGDLTVVNNCAMLFSGSHIVSVGKNGLEYMNRMEAQCAWRF